MIKHLPNKYKTLSSNLILPKKELKEFADRLQNIRKRKESKVSSRYWFEK
jgi:hypothetical protein